MESRWRLVMVGAVTLLTAATLAAPQSEPVSPAEDIVVVSAAAGPGGDPGGDPADPGHGLTTGWPASMTWRGARPHSAAQEAEAAPDDTESAATRSTLHHFGWPPQGGSWPVLQLSPDTLRQCSSAEGRQNSPGEESRAGGGGRNRPVLRAVGCAQAVLSDGQHALLAKLEHLQTALWLKVAYLRSCIEDVLNELSLLGGSQLVDSLKIIEDGIVMLNSGQDQLNESLEDVTKKVTQDMNMLKSGQSFIVRKLMAVLQDSKLLKDGINWLRTTVNRIKDTFGKKTTKLIQGQNEVKQILSSIEKSVIDRLKAIEMKLGSGCSIDDKIYEALEALAASIAMIKGGQSVIQSNLDVAKTTIIAKTIELKLTQDQIIDQLLENKKALLDGNNELKDGQAMIKEDVGNAKGMILSELSQLKSKQDDILTSLANIPNIEPKIDMIIQSLKGVEDTVEANKQKIMAVDNKLCMLGSQFSSFATVQSSISSKVTTLLSSLESLSQTVNKCCDNSGTPTCQPNEIMSGKMCLGCPDGFTVHEDLHCYLFSEQKMKYDGANMFCSDKGSHLATMTPDNELIIFEFAAKNPSDGAWIGLSKTGPTNWMWEDGTQFDPAGYNLFDGDRFNHDCAVASSKSGKNSWIDRPCTANKAFVCRTEAKKKAEEEKKKGDTGVGDVTGAAAAR